MIKGYSVSRDFSWIENYKLSRERCSEKRGREKLHIWTYFYQSRKKCQFLVTMPWRSNHANRSNDKNFQIAKNRLMINNLPENIWKKIREKFAVFGFVIAKHCVKSFRIRSFSGLYFPVFGLNMKSYSVSLRIQSKLGKLRTRKTLNTDTFHAVKC